MPYASPLHIFDGSPLPSLDEAGLKRLRKELLLQFDLHQQTTIQLNGREYDKAALLDVFEELKADTDFHLRIYRNKLLLNFLESGSLMFFNSAKSQEDWHDPAFQPRLAPLILEQLSQVIYRCVVEKGEVSVSCLQVIQRSGVLLTMPPTLRAQAYTQAFSYLQSHFKEGKMVAFEPFVPHSDKRFNAQTREYLHPHYLNVLRELPRDTFLPIIIQYNNLGFQILRKILYKDRRLNLFTRETLDDMLQIAAICLHYDPENEGMRELSNSIRSHLSGGGSTGLGEGNQMWLVVKIVFFVLIFISQMRNCSSSSSRNNGGGAGSLRPPILTLDDYHQPLAEGDLNGQWEAIYRIGPDSARVKHFLHFVSDGTGTAELLLLETEDDGGEEACVVRKVFTWGFTAKDVGGGPPGQQRHLMWMKEVKIDHEWSICKELTRSDPKKIDLMKRHLVENSNQVPLAYYLPAGEKIPVSIYLAGRVFVRE